MDKRRFPLSLVPAPRGWHMLITLGNGQIEHLIKPIRRNEPSIPQLFGSQQEGWTFIKERFSFINKSSESLDPLEMEKIRNCKQCDRIFKAKLQDYCANCLRDNHHILQQLWAGFQLPTDPEFTDTQKITVILASNDDDFSQIPEQFKTLVQKQLALEAEQENETPSPARQLSRIIRSRIPSGRRRRVH